jgi:hypothetical protein
VCTMGSAGRPTPSWWQFNVARDAAIEARNSVCTPPRS